jgi:hypothetical protein
MLNVEIVIDGLLASQQTMKTYFLLIIGKNCNLKRKKSYEKILSFNAGGDVIGVSAWSEV